jgi:hypothetical protein
MPAVSLMDVRSILFDEAASAPAEPAIMAELTPQDRLQPSLPDRLTDDDPETGTSRASAAS